MNNVTELFCAVDDYWQEFEPMWNKQQIESGARQRQRSTRLSMSEVMTIIILFHQSSYRHFKAFYMEYVCTHMGNEFPKLVSYNRFVELMGRAMVPLYGFLHTQLGESTGIAFIDSTPIAVCHNRRIPSHRVFTGIAQRGKTSMGWFYGFKLHLVINDKGEVLAFRLTPGNVDDRKPVLQLTQGLTGKLFGDKGYISKDLSETLFARGLHLITGIRKNMTNKLMAIRDKLLLRKRALIETVNDQLKNISQIEHTRHRSISNFIVNLLAGLIAYCLQPKKPSLNLVDRDGSFLLAHS